MFDDDTITAVTIMKSSVTAYQNSCVTSAKLCVPGYAATHVLVLQELKMVLLAKKMVTPFLSSCNMYYVLQGSYCSNMANRNTYQFVLLGSSVTRFWACSSAKMCYQNPVL